MKVFRSVVALLLIATSLAFAVENNRFTALNANGSGNTGWNNWSTITLLPGNSLLPVTNLTGSPGTKIRFGFVGGTTADITNMVLYVTAQYTHVVQSSIQLTYQSQTFPISIPITSGSSQQAPTIVTLDSIPLSTLTFDDAHDYFIVVYFTNDTANQSVSLIQSGQAFNASMLSVGVQGVDETGLTTGQTVPFPGSNSLRSILVTQVTN